MTKPATPTALKSTSADRHVAVDDASVALTFEDRLRIFWKKNSKGVITLVVIVIAAVLAKGAWDYMEAQKEQEIGREFAAATTSDQLKAFATKHSGHSLASVARLRVADDAYAAGKSAEAVAGYEEAASALKAGPLASRAKLGLAMSKIQAGKTADGEAALKQLASDASEAKGVRLEANYQLASLAASAGRNADVQKYSEQLMRIDPSSKWAERVFMLRASLPVDAAPTATALPALTLPTPGK